MVSQHLRITFFVCLVCGVTSQSTAMVMTGQSVFLTTLFTQDYLTHVYGEFS